MVTRNSLITRGLYSLVTLFLVVSVITASIVGLTPPAMAQEEVATTEVAAPHFIGPCPSQLDGVEVIWVGRSGQVPPDGQFTDENVKQCPAGTVPGVIGTANALERARQNDLDGRRASSVAPSDWDGRWCGLGSTTTLSAGTGSAAIACIAVELIPGTPEHTDELLGSLPEGPPGEMGPAGARGPTGQACWDLDGDGVADPPFEDTNGDGKVDVLDCKGEPGPAWQLALTGGLMLAHDTNAAFSIPVEIGIELRPEEWVIEFIVSGANSPDGPLDQRWFGEIQGRAGHTLFDPSVDLLIAGGSGQGSHSIVGDWMRRWWFAGVTLETRPVKWFVRTESWWAELLEIYVQGEFGQSWTPEDQSLENAPFRYGIRGGIDLRFILVGL